MSYLDEQGIALYLRDALNQLRQTRKNVPIKSSPITPPLGKNNICQFMADYCRSVQYGTHLYKREYGYIMLTNRNRLSFIRLIERQFYAGLIEYETLNSLEFYSLIELLCPDYPIDVIEDTFELIQGKTSIDNILPKLRFRMLFDNFFAAVRNELTFENKKIVILPTVVENKIDRNE